MNTQMITPAERQICQKRVTKEYGDMRTNPIPNVSVACDESDMLSWFCMITALTKEEYIGGEYIVNIKLSPRYPFEAPDFYMLTPNGRFEINKKICFSNSAHHQETWSPIWNMRTIILGFLSFFLEDSSSGIGHIETTKDTKIELATHSRIYNLEKNTLIMQLFGSTTS